MANNILFILEGEKTEKQISNSLGKYFINEKNENVITCAYCTNIYTLYQEIVNDEFLDTFVLLKEIDKNAKILAPYERDDFAEIYLFFDYEGHAPLAGDEKIKDLLQTFQDETGAGKLYISYPMVEALKHLPIERSCFKDLKVQAKQNIKYKKIVGSHIKSCRKDLMHIKKYTKDNWIEFIDLHLSKANFINTKQFCLPVQNFTQTILFNNQLKHYIKTDNTVAVLSAFPIFLFDYYGFEFIDNLINPNK